MRSEIVDFSKYSSIKIGKKLPVFKIESLDDECEGMFIIGGANNLLISDNPPPLAMLDREKFEYIIEDEKGLRVGAFTSGGKLLSYAKKHDLSGFEMLQKLPGTIGGMIKMNAGLKDFSISDNLKSIFTCKGEISKENCGFSYRNSNINGVIFEALFEVKKGFDYERFESFKKARANQPSTPSAGSCFKNPPNDYAGRLIEAVGLKGKRVGDMAFSDVHANFLVNLGSGKYEDALTLIDEAQKRVFEEFGIRLELEIKIV
ncbi:MAG: UDP-N-acetylmuramate dehydrogenase [Campylobacteraceae bacterium]